MPKAKQKIRSRKKTSSKTKSKKRSKARSNSKSFLQATIKSPVPHVRFGFIFLIGSWFFALLPVPFFSYFGMIVCSGVTSILAIVCFFKNQVMSGIWLWLAMIIGTPVFYIIGFFIMGGPMVSWLFGR